MAIMDLLAISPSTSYNDISMAKRSRGDYGIEGRTRLTIDLPKALVEQADMLVRRGVARSRNRLIVEALERFLKDLEEAQIDVQFAEMARDERYIEEQLRIAHEFERSDWEALQLEEGLKRQ
jgi:predicted transcriptional regulator